MKYFHPLSRLPHPREAIRQFTPNWFTATMGTGVLALAINQLPASAKWLHDLAESIWIANGFLFLIYRG